VLAAVLEADLGHRKITRFRLTRPLVIAAVIAAFWIKGVAWSGTGLWVEAAGVGAGIVLGLAAAALMRVYAGDEGRPYSYAWIPYALLWVAVVGARLWFAYASVPGGDLAGQRDQRRPVVPVGGAAIGRAAARALGHRRTGPPPAASPAATQPHTPRQLNPPGESGDSICWESVRHGTSSEELPA